MCQVSSGTTLHALDYKQVFWPHRFLRNHVPAEGEFSLRGSRLPTGVIVGFLLPVELALASF